MAKYDSPGYMADLPGIGSFDPAASNSQGSGGIPANTNVGPVLGEPVVSAQYVSSQLPEGQPTHPVHAGDTSSMSDDIAAHASGINGTSDAAPYMNTGAGDGHVIAPPRPWK